MKSKKLSAALLTALSVLLLAAAFALPASAATSITDAVIKYTSACTYTGSAIKPKVTVTVGEKVLTANDYTVTYKNNVNIGKATLTVKGKGNYTGSVAKSFKINPAAPTSLKATATTNSVTLTWKKGAGATAYQVFMVDPSTGKAVKKATTTGTTATIKSLEPGTLYTFKVRAYAKNSTYYYSSYVTVTAKTTVAKVSGLKFSHGTDSWVKLTWTQTKNANGYQIYVYDSAASAWVRKATSKTNSVYLKKLDSATTYKVRVRAYNNLDSKLVYGSFSSTVYATTKPTAVKALTISSFTSTSAVLNWDKSDRVTGYYIYVGKADSKNITPTFVKTKYTTGTTVTLTNLDPCSYYSFRVLPCYKNTQGKNFYAANTQSETIFTPVPKPDSFKVYEITNNSATLRWTSIPSATGYYISMRTDSEASATLIDTLPANQSSYKIENLDELTNYRFYIAAFKEDGDGNIFKGASAGALAKTDDSCVDSVRFTNVKSSLYVGKNSLFEYEVLPSYAANKKVTFKSSNPTVATVYSNGRVVGLKAGTAKITVTTSDGGFTDTVTVKIIAVKSKSISVPSTLVAYANETTVITPTFTPANTTDKSITITGKNYTYSYKGGILGLQTMTDTCNFSDYVTIDSNGQIIGKKLTIEPETGKRFSFSITIKAKDTGVSTTAKLSVEMRPLKLTYNGRGYPWTYGSKVSLTPILSSNASFTREQIIWQTSNPSVATVNSRGVVTCCGTGSVDIIAYSPDKVHSSTLSVYVNPKITIEKSFFSSCKKGDVYPLSIKAEPAGSKFSISSMNEKMVTVDENLNAKILAEGTSTVIVSTGSTNLSIVFTNKEWTKPSTTPANLLSHTYSLLNPIKEEMPMLIRSDSSVFTNFVIGDGSAQAENSSHLKSSDFEDLFAEFAAPSTKVINAVKPENFGSTADYNTACDKYYSNVPLAGQSVVMLDGIDITNDVRSIEYIDNNGPTYDVKLTLKDEYMAYAAAATHSTRHGKVFDILSYDYINRFVNLINSSGSSSLEKIEVKYNNFAQNYKNSSVTVTVDKVTGNVEYIVYDMNINIAITKLSMSMLGISAYNNDLKFDVNNKIEIDVIN